MLHRTRIPFIALSIVLIISMAFAFSPAQAAGIVVNTAADNDVNDGKCSLREAIIAANTDAAYNGCSKGSGADTITFANNYTITLGGTQLPDIAADTNLTIIGNGENKTILQAASAPNTATSRIFQMYGSLTLENMTLRYGKSTWGGAITAHYGDLTIKNCTLSNNKSIGDGGGIYISDANKITISNSTITHNKASGQGGGIYSSYNVLVFISDNTISNNTSDGSGGGLYSEESLNKTVVSNTTLANNYGWDGGGGIYANDDIIEIKNSIIDKNDTWHAAGGITFYAKSATNKMSIDHVTVSNNTTEDDYGAGIYASGDAYDLGLITINHSIITGNIAYYYEGGGIVNDGPKMIIKHSEVSNNINYYNGDAGIGAWARTTIINTTISGNRAPNEKNVYGAAGLSVYGAYPVTLYNVTITDNHGGTSGGISDWGDTSKLYIYNSIIYGNTGTKYNDCDFTVGTVDFKGAPSILGNATGCTNKTNTAKVIAKNPKLEALANNGGTTQTHAIGVDSPAFNASGIKARPLGQRGKAAYGIRDLGAFEYIPAPSTGNVGVNTGVGGGLHRVNGITIKIPPGAIPSGYYANRNACRIVVKAAGTARDYKIISNEKVWDIKIFCDGKRVTQFNAPIVICIKPSDGITTNKSLFRRHAGEKNFTSLPAATGDSSRVCGSTSKNSLFLVGEYLLPETGFAPATVTELVAQPAELAYMNSDMTLNIPSLGVSQTIVGVPQSADGWNVSWLGNGIGYLAGTAFPTWAGNTALTGHVWNADGSAGIFANLDQLQHGDQFTIEAWGLTYTYEVRDSEQVYATNLSVLEHSDYDIVTLITCEDFSEWSGEYRYRRAVTAVLVSVK